MKKMNTKTFFKQITCIIVIIMLCNFILPSYSFAVSTEDGGSLVDVVAKFACFVPDAIIEFLQNMFSSQEKIKISEENYLIQYSPGIIFSGKIPAFDINFIEPMPAKQVNVEDSRYIQIKDTNAEGIKEVFTRLKENRIESDGYYTISHFADSLNDEIDEICGKYNYRKRDYRGEVTYNTINYDEWYKDNWSAKVSNFILGNQTKMNKFWITDDTMYLMVIYVVDFMAWYELSYAIYETPLTEEEVQMFEDMSIEVETEPVYKESSAAILQTVISTWYNALRRIALVGLLSALLYIGIKILLTSTSAKDKAKYKKMLKDWLVALCLLFTLHYIMSITITVVDRINEVIKASSIGLEGEDILMTSVREKIAVGESWGTVLPYIVIYCVLVVYTIIFTIQYLRRTIYLAFLTVIAPLITLTYPLDKIKDSKSQAFDMWIKDYIFFVLIQVLHLLIYYIFLGSSINLANQGNWLYAIVAIGFMTNAEKLMKKMFGFGKSKTLDVLAAGATGAIVINAINKISHKPPKGGKPGKSNAQKTENSSVRTVTVNPVSIPSIGDNSLQNALKTNANSSQTGSGKSQSTSQKSNNSSSNVGKSRGTKAIDGLKTIWNKPQIKGVRHVAGTFFKNNYRQMAGKVLGVGTSIAGGMISFASGVSEGDATKAFTRLAAGVTAGEYFAQNAVDFAVDTIEKVPEKAHNVADTYREGAYGKEYANRVKTNREFRNSDSYKKLKNDYGNSDKNFDDKITQMLDAEITDEKKMKKILKNNNEHPRKYDMDKAIKYSKMADKCPDEILYNNSKFIKFCNTNNVEATEKELANLRKCIVDFK